MNELIFGVAQIFMVIALPTLAIGFCVAIYQRDKAESRVKELEREKPKRKNNEITPAYRSVPDERPIPFNTDKRRK